MYGWLSIGNLIVKKNWKSYGKYFIGPKGAMWYSHFLDIKVLGNT